MDSYRKAGIQTKGQGRHGLFPQKQLYGIKEGTWTTSHPIFPKGRGANEVVMTELEGGRPGLDQEGTSEWV